MDVFGWKKPEAKNLVTKSYKAAFSNQTVWPHLGSTAHSCLQLVWIASDKERKLVKYFNIDSICQYPENMN
jgi:hypothetical protein